MLFTKGHCLTLPRLHSDHHPIIVSTKGWEQRSPVNQFIFQPMWQTHPLFHQLITNCWSSHESHVMGLDNFTDSFYKKIHHLRFCLAEWNTQVFGQVAQNKKHIRAHLLGTQWAFCCRPTHFLLQLYSHLINQYNAILYQEFLLLVDEISNIVAVLWGRQHTLFSCPS